MAVVVSGSNVFPGASAAQVQAIIDAAMAAITPVTVSAGTVASGASGLNDAFGSWTEVVASTSKNCPANSAHFSGMAYSQDTVDRTLEIQIGLGSVGNEERVAGWYGTVAFAGTGLQNTVSWFVTIPRSIPPGTRISYRIRTSSPTSAAYFNFSYSIGQVA